MTVGDFSDAARRALDAAHRVGDHPLEDVRETAETLAAARVLFTALAGQLHYTAGEGARFQPWGAAVADLAELLARSPLLLRDADPARAQHPLARGYLAAAAAVGLERDVLAASPDPLCGDDRLWVLGETLARTGAAAATLGLLAERIHRLHPDTGRRVWLFTEETARATGALEVALPPVNPDSGPRLLGRRAGAAEQRAVIEDLPERLRPALGRMLQRARAFDRAAPPDRFALYAYTRLLAGGVLTVAAITEHADSPDAAKAAAAWHSATEPLTRLRTDLPNMATLGRRNPVLEFAAGDALTQLVERRHLPFPAPAGQHDRLLAEAAAIGSALRELAICQHRLVTALAAAGDLYQPTRQLDPTEITTWERRHAPSRWLPMPPDRATALAATYGEAAQQVAAAAKRTCAAAGHLTTRHETTAAVTLLGLEQLARVNARTAAATPDAAHPVRPHLRP